MLGLLLGSNVWVAGLAAVGRSSWRGDLCWCHLVTWLMGDLHVLTSGLGNVG